MVLLFLLLILVPAAAWLLARLYRPTDQWLITGTTFGMVVYPFFAALSLPMMYLGFPLGLIGMWVMLLHRAPGHEIVVLIAGHKRLTSFEDLWVYALNAIVWGAVYGFMGWVADRNRARRSKTDAP